MTIQSVNYGNRLQNYALQSILEERGYYVESLRRDSGFHGPFQSKLRMVKRKLGLLKHRNDKIGAFRRFDSSYVSFSYARVSTEYTCSDLANCYDCFVIGSDQVWNPDFCFNSDLEYLPMVPIEKKIAYAASFGVNNIEKGCERTAELLNGIKHISVREAAGADIINKLTDRRVPVVLDPTLLLSPEKWDKISEKPLTVECTEPYAFKYVLGDDVNNRRIQELASSCGLRVIDVMDESFAIGPSEFVWLIAHSCLVCTDSFHASVFALLYRKPLAIFERVSADADMSSRFDTLCSNFGLVGHRSTEEAFGKEAIFDTDWNLVHSRLTAMRDSSLSWLDNALDGVEHG